MAIKFFPKNYSRISQKLVLVRSFYFSLKFNVVMKIAFVLVLEDIDHWTMFNKTRCWWHFYKYEAISKQLVWTKNTDLKMHWKRLEIILNQGKRNWAWIRVNLKILSLIIWCLDGRVVRHWPDTQEVVSSNNLYCNWIFVTEFFNKSHLGKTLLF